MCVVYDGKNCSRQEGAPVDAYSVDVYIRTVPETHADLPPIACLTALQSLGISEYARLPIPVPAITILAGSAQPTRTLFRWRPATASESIVGLGGGG